MKYLFLAAIMATTYLFTSAQADVIEDRKAQFRENVTILRAIQTQIKDGNFNAIAAGGRNIANWAAEMPDFFPKGSESRGTLNAIWLNFESFQAKAAANQQAALSLEQAAETKDAAQIMAALQQVSGSCKSCHQSFKAN